jgi:hypothetical protein
MPAERKENPAGQPQDQVQRRVVLLGASNLMRGISTAIETAQYAWGTPLDVLAACGHGRSYGLTSRVLVRSLPAITKCGLWEDLARRTPLPTAALITDVGNDILYGASVNQIAAWVEQCLERLLPVCQRFVITGLPLSSIAALPAVRFRLIRSMLFPGSQLTFGEASSRTQELDARLVALTMKCNGVFVAPSADWYGWDPIHIRLRYWSRAWNEILSAWCDGTQTQMARGSFFRWLKLRAQRPLYRKMFGIEQQRAQPSCKLRDETIVSFY